MDTLMVLAPDLFPYTGLDFSEPLLVTAVLRVSLAMRRLRFLSFFGFCKKSSNRLAFFKAMEFCFTGLTSMLFVEVIISQSNDGGPVFAPFAFAILPYFLLGIGPLLFLLSLHISDGLWRFLAVDVPDGVRRDNAWGFNDLFYNDASILKSHGFRYASRFIFVKLVLVFLQGPSSVGKWIESFFWSYLITLHVFTGGIIHLGMRNGRKMIQDYGAELRRSEGHISLRLNRFDQVNAGLERISESVSVYLFSQIVIIPITISATIAVITRFQKLDHIDLTYGIVDLLSLSFIQVTMFWRLMSEIKILNCESKNLVKVAKKVYTNYQRASHVEKVISRGLHLIAYYITDNTGNISILGRAVNASMTDFILPLHIAFAFYFGGSVVSSILASPSLAGASAPSPSP